MNHTNRAYNPTPFIHACFKNTLPTTRLHFLAKDIQGLISQYFKVPQHEHLMTCALKKESYYKMLNDLSARNDLYLSINHFNETQALLNTELKLIRCSLHFFSDEKLFNFQLERNKKTLFNSCMEKLRINNIEEIMTPPTLLELKNHKILIYHTNEGWDLYFRFNKIVFSFVVNSEKKLIHFFRKNNDREVLSLTHFDEELFKLLETLVTQNSSQSLTKKFLAEFGLN